MRKAKYAVRPTTAFQKDYKRAIKRGDHVVALLADGVTLPEQNQDHALSGAWVGYRECYILPEWLLIYRIDDAVLVLTLTYHSTHSDLFGE